MKVLGDDRVLVRLQQARIDPPIAAGDRQRIETASGEPRDAPRFVVPDRHDAHPRLAAAAGAEVSRNGFDDLGG